MKLSGNKKIVRTLHLSRQKDFFSKNLAELINKRNFAPERPGNRVTLSPLKPIAPDRLLHFLGVMVLRRFTEQNTKIHEDFLE